jgi:hypothetical protein
MATRGQQTNFIRHQLKVRELFIKDHRLSALHVSLYFALFFEWNENRFQNPFFINRSEIMHACKIGSANTYLKCLKELDQFGYIDYMPSYNPNKGSTINLYTFNTACDTASDISSVQVVIPFNKHNKQKKNKETTTKLGVDLKKIDQAKIEDRQSSLFSTNQKEITENSVSSSSIPPQLANVSVYFMERNSTEHEAEKFFNHFESNGWLVGGKTKMKNWQAAARNWILNSEKFNQQKKADWSQSYSKTDRLHVNQDKQYDIPL